jgi:hypothetical protein
MSKLRFSAVASILTGLCLACSGSNGTSDALPASNDSSDSAGSIAFEELPAKYAAAACTAYQNCFGPILSLFLNGADCASSISQRLENGTFGLIPQKITAGTIRYDGNKAQACLDAVSKLSCDGLLTRDQPECLAALDGLVAQGGDCDLNEECAGSAICRSSTGTCPGKCVALLSAGQACSADGDCASGLQCSSETSLCVKPAVVGDACEYGSPPCGPGFALLGQGRDRQDTGRVSQRRRRLQRCRGRCLRSSRGNSLWLQGFPASRTSRSDRSSWFGHASRLARTWQAERASPASQTPARPAPTVRRPGSAAPAPRSTAPCGTGLDSTVPSNACAWRMSVKTRPTVVHSPARSASRGCLLSRLSAANGVSCTGDDMCYSEYCGATGGCQPPLPCTP